MMAARRRSYWQMPHVERRQSSEVFPMLWPLTVRQAKRLRRIGRETRARLRRQARGGDWRT